MTYIKKAVAIIVLMLAIGSIALAQFADPVDWSFSSEKTGDNTYDLIFKAEIESPWHLYSAYVPENGPIATRPSFEDNDAFQLVGEIREITKPKVKFDEGFQMEIGTIARAAEFRQTVKITSGTAISGEMEYQVCNDMNCLPPAYEEFTFTLGAVTNETTDQSQNDQESASEGELAGMIEQTDNTENTSPGTETSATSEKTAANATLSQATTSSYDLSADANDQSLWAFFWIAFGAGLLALLTPCVFPMIPMTVSFFMQGSENRTRSVLRGSVFGFSIIAIYTMLGVIVSLTNLGPDAANALSTHWVPNLIFFLLFVIFAFSFFGMFELVLPSKWINKADQGADKGGLAGAFFMAVTTVLVSFSCTGPIVGALLVEAAGGLSLKPILGMFGFALAFAIPFTLFAIFPSLLKGLPKSGGWLNSVKVILGFVVLAFSTKFLLPLDPTHKIFSREVVLVIWTILFFLMGMYLLGKIKFAHDSDLPFIKVPRLLLAIAAFAFAVFMFMGLFGAQLKMVAPLLPPKSPGWIDLTMTSNMSHSVVSSQENLPEECTPVKHTDEFHTAYGIKSFYDLQEGLDCAEATGKPVFIDFTGRFCSNCKKMEASVWSDPTVQAMLKNDFIVISLYTDVNKKLPEDEWYTSKLDGKVKNTIGKQNVDYQISMFQTNTVPLYVIMDSEGNVVNKPKGTDLNVNSYTAWMKEGLTLAK